MMPGTPERRGPVRCAIYTRKSSEEGLEQRFNSLDAQAEACAAYILSQASEGWVKVPERYDDGGLSGGTLERPALQRLLADVAAGRIDIIVVYKVDRLTRSLLDFAKLVEAFDTASVSFVSITQSFNTTTSMGRLTLNMLLSFAQFEREVTAERIRDKIAASKARGMWMGGIPPLGYKPDGRSLAIVEEHAALVRHIVGRYLALGNVRQVTDELRTSGTISPERHTTKGTSYGGLPFSRGQIYGLLRCPTYVGEIHHQGQVHAGLHQPIIARETWDAVQALLTANRQGHRRGSRSARPSPLAGRIVDEHGAPLIASHATKGKARYRYYVSKALVHGPATPDSATGMRIPALPLERLVAERIAQALGDPIEVIATAGLHVEAHEIERLHDRCASLAAQLRERPAAHLADLVDSVHVEAQRIVVRCATATLAAALEQRCTSHPPATIVLACEDVVARSGRALRLVDRSRAAPAAEPDRTLLRLLVQARQLWAQLRRGELDITALAAREGMSPSYLTRVVRLAFLSPAVVEAIVSGRTGPKLTAVALTLRGEWPAAWSDQKAAFL